MSHIIWHVNKCVEAAGLISDCLVFRGMWAPYVFHFSKINWKWLLPLANVSKDACYAKQLTCTMLVILSKGSLPHLCPSLWCALWHTCGRPQSLGPSCSPTGWGCDSGSDRWICSLYVQRVVVETNTSWYIKWLMSPSGYRWSLQVLCHVFPWTYHPFSVLQNLQIHNW